MFLLTVVKTPRKMSLPFQCLFLACLQSLLDRFFSSSPNMIVVAKSGQMIL